MYYCTVWVDVLIYFQSMKPLFSKVWNSVIYMPFALVLLFIAFACALVVVCCVLLKYDTYVYCCECTIVLVGWLFVFWTEEQYTQFVYIFIYFYVSYLLYLYKCICKYVSTWIIINICVYICVKRCINIYVYSIYV